MAEGLLRQRLVQRGVADVTVHSAGLLAGGAPASEPAVRLLAEQGVDISAHESTTVTRELVDSADLVIAMAREHLKEAVMIGSDAWPRTFTFRELVRRGEAVDPRADDEQLEKWLLRISEGRQRSDLLTPSRDDDIADPIGRPDKVYRRTISELDELTSRLVAVVWSPELGGC
jgi:protein-tyrosine phosphatase